MLVYRLLCILLTPFFFILALYRLLKGKEVLAHIGERFGFSGADRTPSSSAASTPPLWVHAASVGESLSVLPLIEKIQQEHPGQHIVMTSYTKTAATLIKSKNIPNLTHQFIPYDHPLFVFLFLRHWAPKAVLWVESEFWPEALHQIAQRELPAALINLRFSQKSFRRWKKFAPNFIRARLNTFAFIHAQSDVYKDFIEDLSGRDVAMISNLKCAVPPLPFDAQALTALQNSIGERQIVLYASTHKGEEDALIQMHQRLCAQHTNLLGIIVPRHPERGAEIEGLLNAHSATFSARSRQQDITQDTEFYLADTLGELGLFYRLSPITVIGNSFIHTPGGGHNPLEAAHLECCILYGPSIYNFQTMHDDMQKASAVLQVSKFEALEMELKALLSDSDRCTAYASNALTFAQKQGNIAEELYQALQDYLRLGSHG